MVSCQLVLIFDFRSETEFCHVVQAGFKLEILLFQPPKCWDYRLVLPHLALVNFCKEKIFGLFQYLMFPN
jgi:hypothetical protein